VQGDIWKDRSKLDRKIGALFYMKRVYIALLLTVFPALAELTLPNLFSDGMVLQRNTTAPIWGWTEPNAPVKLSFAGEDHGTRADQNGDWKIVLKSLKGNAKGSQLVVEAAGSKRVIKDVLVGEVWLASGQSNMEWRVSGSANAKEEVAKANDPLLRVFVSANVAENRPQKNWQGNWKATQSQDTGSFTAVGYYFAKKLREELGVPVGVIECAWGGKPVQAFTSEEALGELPAGKKLLEMKAKALAGYDSKKVDENFKKQVKAYKEKLAQWKNDKKGRKPRGPRKVSDPGKNPSMPSTIYNGMIAPIVGYGNRGAIWYQGEANANGGTARSYEELLGCMVGDWRQRWGHDLSFYWVQLANFREPTTEAGTESDWVVVQDEMRRALKSIPKSGMAVINDIGDARDIHPKNKHDVGERLARWALVQDYGKKDVVISGPLYSGMEKRGGKIVVSFDHASGLEARDGKALKRFEIAGPDGKWQWAQAKIDGDKILIWHDAIKNPTKARYAWASNPLGANLVNGEGLPASCFTTE
jgi:sialate O-acetylesterase